MFTVQWEKSTFHYPGMMRHYMRLKELWSWDQSIRMPIFLRLKAMKNWDKSRKPYKSISNVWSLIQVISSMPGQKKDSIDVKMIDLYQVAKKQINLTITLLFRSSSFWDC